MSLKDTLAIFQERPRSISELSQMMGMDKDATQDRLDQLVRMGFLLREDPATPASKKCRGCGGCGGIGCHSTGPSYRISEKGVRTVQ